MDTGLLLLEISMGNTRPRDHDRWIVLTLHLRGGVLIVDYVDETGLKLEQVAHAHAPTKSAGTAANSGATAGGPARGVAAIERLIDPPKAGSQLESLLHEATDEFRAARWHAMPPGEVVAPPPVPWLLPVFVNPPHGLEALPWEHWLDRELSARPMLAQRCVFVRWQRTRSPLEPLPLPWVLLDRRGPDTDSLATLRQQPWYTPDVGQHGLRLYGESARPSLPPHITIEQWRGGVDVGQAAWLNQRRLRVQLCGSEPVAWERPDLQASAVSTLTLHEASAASVDVDPVVNLVYALVHDFALHEVAWILRRCHPGLQVSLASNPQANQSLRLSRTMQQMRDEVQSGRLAPPVAAPRTSDRLKAVHDLRMLFTSEREGLTQMAEWRAAGARGDYALFAAVPAPSDPPRQVEITLQRFDEYGVAQEVTKEQRKHPLRCGWRYRLAVQIGQADPEFTMFTQPPPSIDPLLPPLAPGKVHEIEVCVFAKDFTLLSKDTQVLTLGASGPSNAAFFELRAPAQRGVCDLRIVLYHQNNLLQSFVLEARVAPDAPVGRDLPTPGADAETCVLAKLASSGVADFSNWRAPGRRALSVAMNDDLQPGRHRLMIKGEGARIEATLSDEKISKLVQRFGHIATGIAEGEEFELTVRKLAQLGAEIWALLERKRGDGNPVLAQLRSADVSQTLQFVRHGDQWTLPWQLVYDLVVPEGDDFTMAPICMGRGPVRRRPGTMELGCRHHPGEPVICLEGFWNWRHRIELISEDRAAPPPGAVGGSAVNTRTRRVIAPAPHPLVALGRSLGSDAAVNLEEWLREHYRDRLEVFKPGKLPIDERLWQDQHRPALLVFYSHMHEADEDKNLPQRLYACESTAPAHQISSLRLTRLKAAYQAWPEPTRPLVLLMACKSAQRRMLALNEMTDTLLDIGASAVVGSECDLLASEATRFSQHVARTTLRARRPLALGDAMRAFHRQCLSQRDCVSFAFTAYGDADLRIVSGSG